MYQLVLLKSNVITQWTEPGKKVGDVVWVRDLAAAQHLLDNGIAAWPKTAPREIQEVPAAAERKSFGERTAGPSTASPSSNELGKEQPLSASAAVLVSPRRL